MDKPPVEPDVEADFWNLIWWFSFWIFHGNFDGISWYIIHGDLSNKSRLVFIGISWDSSWEYHGMFLQTYGKIMGISWNIHGI